jgi:very-short-patch-repair endonuclease
MSSYEEYFIKIFKKNQIKFIREKTFQDLKKGKFRYDFYLPNENILIEIDGEYHFHPIQGRAILLK